MTHVAPTHLPSPNEHLAQECTACRNQQAIPHVDFDAEVDRGFYGNDEATRVTLENMIVCEGCIREAMQRLGIEDGTLVARERDEAVANAERMRKERDQAQRYADTLEDAVHQKGVHIDHRRKPRQIREEAAVA